jgi:sulfonate transport system ATP-binding protein
MSRVIERTATEVSPTTTLAVHLRGVHQQFGSRTILDSIDLDIPEGQFVALLGASGSGKTTLLRILAGIDVAETGDVFVPEVRTVVFQEPRLVQSKRVWRNVAVGQGRGTEVKRAALDALREVGLGEHLDSWPATLSGGEAQRVALARALVRQPQLLLMDEPFAALDALTRLNMQELVSELCRRHNPAVLIVTHDVDEAILLADRILVLRAGGISLDVTLDFARPRVKGGSDFSDLRLRLLRELGALKTA